MKNSALLHCARMLLVSRSQPTLKEDGVPLVFQEPGVKSGYRVSNCNWSYYFLSIFHVHCETINIWSHLIGCLLMSYQFYSYAGESDIWSDDRRRVVHVFNICCVVYTLLSALAHTIHSKSDFIHYISFQMDYGGVGLYAYGTGLIAFYISCYDEGYYKSLEPVFLLVNTLLAWLCCVCCSLAKLLYTHPYPFQRKLWNLGSVGCHLLLCNFGSLKRYYTCFLDGRMDSMNHHSVYIVLFCTSIFFFSSHLPEKIWPGKCDIVGQGHQIFHVLIIFTSYLQLLAAESDLKQYVPFQRKFPTWNQLIASLAALLFLDCVTILAFVPFVKRRIEKEKQL